MTSFLISGLFTLLKSCLETVRLLGQHMGFVLQVLLAHGANIEAKSSDGFTPLIIASHDGHFGVLKVSSAV